MLKGQPIRALITFTFFVVPSELLVQEVKACASFWLDAVVSRKRLEKLAKSDLSVLREFLSMKIFPLDSISEILHSLFLF
jgi:hypothetical protein